MICQILKCILRQYLFLLNESKGFGFIKDNGSDKEYFVHVSGLSDQVRENDEVTFDLQEGKKGLNAVNVKLA